MENEKTEPKELPKWDDLNTDKLPGVELFDGKKHAVTFLAERPFETESKKMKGKKVMLFEVMEDSVRKTLIVTSIRLAVELKKLAPLKDKTVIIARVGQGTNIKYEVDEVPDITVHPVGKQPEKAAA